MTRAGDGRPMYKVVFNHWQTGETLTVSGIIDPKLNNDASDRLVVTKADGSFEDIIKSTIIEQSEIAGTTA
jgi:hypothetical protein